VPVPNGKFVVLGRAYSMVQRNMLVSALLCGAAVLQQCVAFTPSFAMRSHVSSFSLRPHSCSRAHYTTARPLAADSLRMAAASSDAVEANGASTRSPARAAPNSLRTVIKFGGSSLATADRLMEVATLVKLLISQGQRPTMVCSAMGKTTNNLLSAGNFALDDGKVYIDAIRTLHLTTVEQLQLGEVVRSDIEGLLSELSSLLKGVSFLRELTPRTKDHLVSFGERMSVRMVAAVLNKVGVPAQHFDAWTLGKRAHRHTLRQQ
jgi:Amino acid kinase family